MALRDGVPKGKMSLCNASWKYGFLLYCDLEMMHPI